MLVIQKIELFQERLIRPLGLVGSQPNQSDFVAVIVGIDIVMMDAWNPVVAAGQ